MRRVAAEVQEQIEAIRPLHELATRKPPPLHPAKLRAAEARYSGEQATEVGELIRRVQAGDVEL